MKIKNLHLLLLAILFFQCAMATAQQKKKKKNRETTQTVLFDGASTDAWKDIKSESFPAHGWVIKDGILTVLAKTDEHDGGT